MFEYIYITISIVAIVGMIMTFGLISHRANQ